jgi:hypothetical protein
MVRRNRFDDADSWVQTQVTGPGVLTFWWKVLSDIGSDSLEFYVGSTLQASVSGDIDWVQKSQTLPSGTHTVKWRYVKDLFGANFLDAGWIDELRFVPTIDLAESLDVPWMSIPSGGPAGWIGQTNVTHDGVDAAQIGSVLNAQISWIQMTVRGPMTLPFWWKVSSEANFDFLEFYVSGQRKKQISGEVDWTEESFEIPAGWQTLRWQYTKDQTDFAGQDKGWIDGLGLPLPFGLEGDVRPDRSFLLHMTGVVSGTTYQLETSSNSIDWQPLTRFTGAVSEIWIVDSTAITAPTRFYRAVSP